MRIARYGLLAGAAFFGVLVAARAILGPLSFPVPVHTPINIESFCGFCLMAALAVGMSSDSRGIPHKMSTVSLAWMAALGLLVVLSFWRAFGTYFLADDFILVQRAVQGSRTIVEGDTFFRPVFFLSLGLIAKFAKLNPFLWHATSLMIHFLNSALVLVLALRLGFSRSAAFFAGALFGIHGALPESVVWVGGESGLIPTFFVLCGLNAFLAHLRADTPMRWWYGGVSLACMVVAFLAKESAYVFPLLAGLLVVSERVPPRKAATMLLIFTGVGLCIFIYRWKLLGGIGGYRDDSSGVRLLAEVGFVQVLRSLFLRLWAVLYFPINWSRQPGLVLGIISGAYVAALLWMTKEGASRLRLLFPLGFLFLSALPPIQQLLIGADLQKSRALYLSSVGFALLLAAAIEPLKGPARWVVPSTILLFHFSTLQHNLSEWRRAGEVAKRTCVATAECAFPGVQRLEVWNMPGSLDGVYFLGVGFNECVKMQSEASLPMAEFKSGNPPPVQEDTEQLLWDEMNSDLLCVRSGKK